MKKVLLSLILFLSLSSCLHSQIVIFKPTEIFKLSITGPVYVSAKIDNSTIYHFVGGFLLSLVSEEISLGTTIGMEISDAADKTQGFDLGDFTAGVEGILLHRMLKLPSIFSEKRNKLSKFSLHPQKYPFPMKKTFRDELLLYP